MQLTKYPTTPSACPSCGRAANEPCRHGRKAHSRLLCKSRALAAKVFTDGRPLIDDELAARMRVAPFTAEQSAQQ